MIKDIVSKINELNKQLDDELKQLSPKDAMAEAMAYKQSATTIEITLQEQLFRDNGYSLDIRDGGGFRVWHPRKSDELEKGKYYHVYFDIDFEVEQSTLSEEDLADIKRVLGLGE